MLLASVPLLTQMRKKRKIVIISTFIQKCFSFIYRPLTTYRHYTLGRRDIPANKTPFTPRAYRKSIQCDGGYSFTQIFEYLLHALCPDRYLRWEVF